jgi:hypothetical protein
MDIKEKIEFTEQIEQTLNVTIKKRKYAAGKIEVVE